MVVVELRSLRAKDVTVLRASQPVCPMARADLTPVAPTTTSTVVNPLVPVFPVMAHAAMYHPLAAAPTVSLPLARVWWQPLGQDQGAEKERYPRLTRARQGGRTGN